MTAPPVVEFARVTRSYPGPPPVLALREADLTVAAGEYVSVTGPSGSGKSTFLNLVGLLDRPDGGVYRLDGIDTAALPDADRTALRGRRIGFVFQSFHLLRHRSVLENVKLAMIYTAVSRRARTGLALETLDRVGLTQRAYARAGHLSGGEAQRVAIARALVNRPSLLLCDEPTGNLDSANAAAVLALIGELNGAGLTVLMVTHDQQVAARAYRSVLIKDGVLR
ncbi:putative ABC transport system ATP-binding protein [Actinoplanes campanulatus]|uniref:Peptide ABC transporter ATP-binding protein n=1 Tax=Actinoplanes campanulatus TaxID=113559 RepID=A0A7W5FD36_9ACTN|nr:MULTISPECIES: ABC transporter ATP-binding protein [Actinoplanes]MBB3094043.1 putative ABC transport system ATP-binding protein [Actinoplanes campanulatus]GGN33116.1 peptide ABC transporter ATP-binding protein [Actinoplanes campanulatus]GID38259.1 peptide ABC transporter ATP-binding protein [Actinoplanes campanulatus]GID49008.1 peptide ABC transporter ATP-binding protein [Actinoplanes capillaceus]